jgi:uncharacterized membrane protein YbhN (UPF0104 family)
MNLAERLALLRPGWPWLKRLGLALFFGWIAWLVASEARGINWPAVLAAGQQVPAPRLLLATGLATASHLLYSCFDLLGRRYTGHRLRAPTVMTVTFVSYVFNLNLGSLVGAVALRYRLYGRLGLRYSVITRVLGLSMLTNWLGYVLLAGLVFSLSPPDLPPGWQLGSAGLRALGVALLLAALAYLLACGFSERRRFHVRGHRFTLPGLRLALLQLALSVTNWLLMGSLLYVLMPEGAAWLQVVSVLLVAAIAGVLSHVPAGLGVLEAVFLALMGSAVPRAELLASLLLYRAFYYLLPLGLATLLYGVTEARARRLAAEEAPPLPASATPPVR